MRVSGAGAKRRDAMAGLGGRMAAGFIWLGAAKLATNLLGFVGMVVVARLLTPEDFGVVAVGVGAMQLLHGLTDFGAAQAVVRFREAGRAEYDTLFTVSAARGVAIGAALVAAAPFVASALDDPRIAGAMFAAAAQPLFAGLSNPRFHEYERDLDFSRDASRVIAAKLASVAVSIAVALAARDHRAIFAGLAAGAFVQFALSYAMRPYLPRLSLSRWREVWGFSGWLAGVGALAAVNNKLDGIILARIAGPFAAGSFYFGLQLAELPTREFSSQIARALYPGLSMLQGDPARMRGGFLRAVEALGVVAMPLSFGLAFVARDFVAIFLGAGWAGAAPAVELLAPVLGLQTLFLATQHYAMALGRTELLFFRELIFAVVRLPVFIAATIGYGLEGAIAAAAALGLFQIFLDLIMYERLSGGSFREPLAAAHRSLGAVAAMVLFFVLLRPWLDESLPVSLFASLVRDVACGGAVYVGALLAIWRAEGSPGGAERLILNSGSGLLARLRRN